MTRTHAILHALSITASMTWAITWALILGFGLSAVIQALVRKSTIVRLLGDDRPRTLAVATGLGAASSSCSYAAVALARSLFRKGASFTAAMAFEVASTNLVIELGVILALLTSIPGGRCGVCDRPASSVRLGAFVLADGHVPAWSRSDLNELT